MVLKAFVTGFSNCHANTGIGWTVGHVTTDSNIVLMNDHRHEDPTHLAWLVKFYADVVYTSKLRLDPGIIVDVHALAVTHSQQIVFVFVLGTGG
jgi:hypothetical protein